MTTNDLINEKLTAHLQSAQLFQKENDRITERLHWVVFFAIIDTLKSVDYSNYKLAYEWLETALPNHQQIHQMNCF